MRAFLHRLLTATLSLSLALTPVEGAPTDIHAETHLKSTSYLGGLMGSTTDLRTLSTTHVGSGMQVAGDIGLTAGRDLTLVAADITAGGAFTTDVGGTTTLLAAVDLDYQSLFQMSNNGILITTKTSEDLTEAAFHTRIDAAGGVNFDSDSPITIAATRDAFINGGHPAGWLGDGESGHMALADSLLGLTPPEDPDPTDTSEPSDWRLDMAKYGVTAALPEGVGYEYLSEVAARPDTTLEPIVLLDYSHFEKTTQISPAAMALLSIAIGQFVGPWLSNIGLVTQATTPFMAGFLNASVSSVITQSIAGVVSGEFDIGNILQGAVFAGLGGGLSSAINLGELVGASGDSILGIAPVAEGVAGILSPSAILDGFGDALVSGALSVAQNGGSFGEAVLGSFVSSLTSQAMAALQHGIGDLTLQGLAEGSLGHMALHGLVGCAFAEVSGGDCAAGFAAGAAQALYAGSLEGTGPVSDLQQQNRAQLLGAFVGFVLSSGEAVNVSLGGQIAQSGIANNRQLHRDEVERIEENAQAFIDYLCQTQNVCNVTEEQAIGILIAAALAKVDSGFAGGTPSTDLGQAAHAFLETLGQGQTISGTTQTFFSATEEEFYNHQLNAGYLLENADAYSLASQFGEETYTGIDDYLLNAIAWLHDSNSAYESPEDMAILAAQFAALSPEEQGALIAQFAETSMGPDTYLAALEVLQDLGATPADVEAFIDARIAAELEFTEVMHALIEKGAENLTEEQKEFLAAMASVSGALGTAFGGAKLLKFIKLPSFGKIRQALVEEGRLQPSICSANCDAEAGDSGGKGPGKVTDYSTLSTAKPNQRINSGSLEEQLVWNEVVADPKIGKSLQLNSDPRFPTSDGWQKMEHTHKTPDGQNITIHYQYNSITGNAYDMKFVSSTPVPPSSPFDTLP